MSLGQRLQTSVDGYGDQDPGNACSTAQGSSLQLSGEIPLEQRRRTRQGPSKRGSPRLHRSWTSTCYSGVRRNRYGSSSQRRIPAFEYARPPASLHDQPQLAEECPSLGFGRQYSEGGSVGDNGSGDVEAFMFAKGSRCFHKEGDQHAAGTRSNVQTRASLRLPKDTY